LISALARFHNNPENIYSPDDKYCQRGELQFMTKRILIAEDEEVAREALANLATMQGYAVTTVTNGVDLLSIAVKERFDVVITDLMMELDGVSAANILKMQGNTTPVIALTGVSAHDMHIVQDSFTRIFYKPVDVNELFEYLETLISKYRANDN
jgi:two-component system, OmpR family, response regulator MprA